MGKILKFCNSCDEGFAEKFGFCPNCGNTLQAFEMNPVAEAAPVGEAAPVEAVPLEEAAPVTFVTARLAEDVNAAPVEAFEEVAEPLVEEEPIEEIHAVEFQNEEIHTVELLKEKVTAAQPYFRSTPIHVDRQAPVSFAPKHDTYAGDGEFYVTVIEEKNVGQRNALLAGTLGLMILAVISAVVINIFTKNLEVGSINDDIFLASLIDDVPMDIKEELEKKNKDDGGGGGGGGREEEEEVTQGDLADQSEKPVRAPDAKVHRMDSELKLETPTTQGNRTFEKKFDRWGDPNGRFASWSNGTGSGGGQGSGTGTGQGSGRGTGAGSGDGSGSGSGSGDGNGDGTGSGGSNPPPPPPAVARVTTPLKILAKPKARYTDGARTANVQGTVVLRVTFLASGQIGNVSTVRGLPHGLTESAIAAARGIRFEPAKVNGVSQTTIRSMEIAFAIY